MKISSCVGILFAGDLSLGPREKVRRMLLADHERIHVHQVGMWRERYIMSNASLEATP